MAMEISAHGGIRSVGVGNGDASFDEKIQNTFEPRVPVEESQKSSEAPIPPCMASCVDGASPGEEAVT